MAAGLLKAWRKRDGWKDNFLALVTDADRELTCLTVSEDTKRANELRVGLRMTHGVGSVNLRRTKIKKALKLQKKLFDASNPQPYSQHLKVGLLDDLISTKKLNKRPSALDNIVLRPNQSRFV
jgi:hypothetical protein